MKTFKACFKKCRLKIRCKIMVAISVFILLIIFESSKLLSNAFNTYCSLPCPFTGPAQPPSSYGTIQLPPRRPRPIARSSFYDAYTDYDEIPEASQPQPLPNIRSRQQPARPDPPPPKPKPKQPPEDTKPPPEDPEPPQKKRCYSPPSCPSIQPSRRFFTSLFSIPGAVVDTLIGGEITL